MEENISAEQKLEQLNEERKVLKEQVKDEKKEKLEIAIKMRVIRDKKIEEIQIKLRKISEIIYRYNKLGKVEKNKVDILATIIDEINDVEKNIDTEGNKLKED